MQPPQESSTETQSRLTRWVKGVVGYGRSGEGAGGSKTGSTRSLQQLAKWRQPPSAFERLCEFDYDYYVAIGARQRPFRRGAPRQQAFR